VFCCLTLKIGIVLVQSIEYSIADISFLLDGERKELLFGKQAYLYVLPNMSA
jgi:hypothetical protein